jgi:Domain of unknown function (DUF4157)
MGLAATRAPQPAARVAPAAKPPDAARPRLRLVQRSCDCGGPAGVFGRCESCNHGILRPQRAGANAAEGGDIAPPVVHAALAMPGLPLDVAARKTLEFRLGHDFSRVRIHTGPLADRSAQAIGANAYTVGQDIVFRAGQYRPGTAAGDRLLAHELTHTTQQASALPSPILRVGPSHDAHERAAASAAAGIAQAPASAAPAAVQRQRVQRQSADAAPAEEPGLLDSLVGASAEVLWGLVKKVAPAGVIDVIQAVRSKGIVGYLKDKLGGVVGKVFGGLDQGGAGAVSGLLGTFTQLMAAARTVLGALAHGDCKPLFDAIGKLGDTLGAMAGDAWDRIKSFLAPVGDFFTGLWAKFGAPAVDFITGTAADVWAGIKSLGAQIWNVASSVVSPAWNWLKSQLGIGDGPDDQNGLLQWVERKLGEAWDSIKSVLDPVIAPMKAFAAKIAAVLPIDAILNLRQRVHEWLQHAGSMVGNLQSPTGATANQASLRERILPAVKAAIVSLGGQITAAGGWVAAQIGGLVQSATSLFGSIKSNSILGAFSGAIDWVNSKVQALGDWVQNGVRGLFDAAGQAVARLSGFVEPLLGVLQKLVSVIGNVVKELPGLVLGPVWALIPRCIRDPIKDFIIQHILSQIPIISTFLKLPEIWTKIQKLVMDFLAAVFVNGDLGGAAMMVVRFVLEAVGVDVNLFLSVLAKAITVIDDVIMHPLNFLKNIGAALVLGFRKFWDHIGANLAAALQSWILAPLASIGVTPMKDFSLGSVFQMVMQVLGITMQKLRAKLEKAIGAKAMGVIGKIASVLESAWHWISTLWTKGPAALWEEIKSQLADLGSAIIGGITSWIATDLVKAGIAALAKMSNPAGAIIQLIQTVYTVIQFVVTKLNRILALVDSVLNSIAAIVKGQIGPAADAIEKSLVGAIASVLSFLADWLGISNPGEKIKEIVEKIQMKVDAALDWLIARAVAFVQKLFGKGKEDEDPKWTAAVAAINAELKGMEEQGVSSDDLNKAVPRWKQTYGFTSLTVVANKDGWEIDGAMSPAQKVATVPATGSREDPFGLSWPKPASSGYPPLYLGGVTNQTKSQDDLKILNAKGQNDETGNTVKEYKPDTNSTLAGGDTIGIPGAMFVGKVIGPLSDRSTPGGGKLRRVLAKYGFSPAGEYLDMDHVQEIQFGGADELSNLWPLDASVNRSAGSRLSQAAAQFRSGKTVPISELKADKTREYWFKITGTER